MISNLRKIQKNVTGSIGYEDWMDVCCRIKNRESKDTTNYDIEISVDECRSFWELFIFLVSCEIKTDIEINENHLYENHLYENKLKREFDLKRLQFFLTLLYLLCSYKSHGCFSDEKRPKSKEIIRTEHSLDNSYDALIRRNSKIIIGSLMFDSDLNSNNDRNELNGNGCKKHINIGTNDTIGNQNMVSSINRKSDIYTEKEITLEPLGKNGVIPQTVGENEIAILSSILFKKKGDKTLFDEYERWCYNRNLQTSSFESLHSWFAAFETYDLQSSDTELFYCIKNENGRTFLNQSEKSHVRIHSCSNSTFYFKGLKSLLVTRCSDCRLVVTLLHGIVTVTMSERMQIHINSFSNVSSDSCILLKKNQIKERYEKLYSPLIKLQNVSSITCYYKGVNIILAGIIHGVRFAPYNVYYSSGQKRDGNWDVNLLHEDTKKFDDTCQTNIMDCTTWRGVDGEVLTRSSTSSVIASNYTLLEPIEFRLLCFPINDISDFDATLPISIPCEYLQTIKDMKGIASVNASYLQKCFDEDNERGESIYKIIESDFREWLLPGRLKELVELRDYNP